MKVMSIWKVMMLLDLLLKRRNRMKAPVKMSVLNAMRSAPMTQRQFTLLTSMQIMAISGSALANSTALVGKQGSELKSKMRRNLKMTKGLGRL